MQTVRQRLIELSTLPAGTFREHLNAIDQNVNYNYIGSGNVKGSAIIATGSVKGSTPKIRSSAIKGVVG